MQHILLIVKINLQSLHLEHLSSFFLLGAGRFHRPLRSPIREVVIVLSETSVRYYSIFGMKFWKYLILCNAQNYRTDNHRLYGNTFKGIHLLCYVEVGYCPYHLTRLTQSLQSLTWGLTRGLTRGLTWSYSPEKEKIRLKISFQIWLIFS